MKTKEELAAYDRSYRLANREKIRERASVWRKENADKIRKSNADYRARNPEKIRAGKKDWIARNPDKEKAQRAAFRQANRAKIRAEGRKWYASGGNEYLAAWRAANPDRVLAASRRKDQREREDRESERFLELLTILPVVGGVVSPEA